MPEQNKTDPDTTPPATEDEDRQPEATDAADKSDEDTDPEGAEQLGDAGKKALDAMKAQMREERTKRRAVEAQLAELTKRQPTPAAKPKPEPKADDKSGAEAPDPEEIRREVEAELKAKMAVEQSRERVLDKIEVKAAKSFADPADAPLMLMRERKIDDFLDDDGKPDVEAIQDALAELLENKPYLAAAAQGGGKRFQGTGDGGAKPPKPTRPKSLNEAVTRALTT